MKLDILAFAAHPDDVELSCSATIAKHISKGFKVGIVDLTKGELGTRGTAETRKSESEAATQILGINAREQLDLGDGVFENNHETRLALIEMIRKYQPDIVLCNAPSDRHPDHGRAGKLEADACFFSGLAKIKTSHQGVEQEAWRPRVVYHYIQDYYLKPDFVVDVTEFVPIKMEAVKAFKTQFYDPNSSEPETPIAKKDFFDFILGRMKEMGREAGAEYAEGFICARYPAVDTLDVLK
jgi:bacillithiol biosynthesis deacetylase BshB1